MGREVDVSLTAIRPRIGRLTEVVASILAQEPAPARVLIHLSREGYLLDEGVHEVPPDLAGLVAAGRVELRWVANTGPYRKILPWLAEHRGTDRWVVTADDDTIYPQGWLARLVAGRAATGAVTGWTAHPIVIRRGRVAGYGRWFGAEMPEGPALAVLPIGKDGVLYSAADFPAEVMDLATAQALAPTADDLWLRWHLARVGVRAQAVGQGVALEEVSRGGPSLWRAYNRQGGNDAVVAALEAHFAAAYGWTMA
ncbi:MAG: hypothetical protein RIR62_3295, partial [Pseudomonadota bacterium]